jgi:hypothetical protein
MGDKDIPDHAAGKEKRDNAGGITNRPLDEEVENQHALPERGRSQGEERTRSNEDIEQ